MKKWIRSLVRLAKEVNAGMKNLIRSLVRWVKQSHLAKEFEALIIALLEQDVRFRLGGHSREDLSGVLNLFPRTPEAEEQIASLRALWTDQIKARVESWHRVFKDAIDRLSDLRDDLSDSLEQEEKMAEQMTRAAEQRSGQEQQLAEKRRQRREVSQQILAHLKAGLVWLAAGAGICLVEGLATLSMLQVMFEPATLAEWVQVGAIAAATTLGLVWSAARTYHWFEAARRPTAKKEKGAFAMGAFAILLALDLLLGLLRVGSLIEAASPMGLGLVLLQLLALPLLALSAAWCLERSQTTWADFRKQQSKAWKLWSEERELREALARPGPETQHQRIEQEQRTLASRIDQAEGDLRRTAERVVADILTLKLRRIISGCAKRLAEEKFKEEEDYDYVWQFRDFQQARDQGINHRQRLHPSDDVEFPLARVLAQR